MDVALQVVLWVTAVLLVVIGIAGLVLPAMPGPPLIFGGLLLAAWIEDFAYVGWVALTLLGALAALTYAVDFAASATGASRFGASPRGVWGALLGGLVGIAFGPVGLLLGPFVGALLAELSLQRPFAEVGRAGFGATLGVVVGAALKLALAFAMLAIYLIARLF